MANIERSGTSFITPSKVETFASAPPEATEPRTLLEPGDFLMAIARPFFDVSAAIVRIAKLPIVRREGSTPQGLALENRSATGITERSFASEVASLFQAAVESVVPCRERAEASTSSELPVKFEAPSEFAVHGIPDRSAGADATSEPQANLRTPLRKPETVGERLAKAVERDAQGDSSPERDAPAEAPQVNSLSRETRDSVRLDESDNDASRSSASKYGPSYKHDGIGSENRPEQNIVIVPIAAHRERAVPITRLPLRPQGLAITWTTEVPEIEHAASLSRIARHRLLEDFVRNPGNVSSDVFARAYHEEEGDGRAIALRILLRNFPQAGRSAFIEALRVGSDEERALAVDGLAAIAAREELTPAFSDRVDAIAAKAALVYVGTLERADYRAQLSRFIDKAQIDAILDLLAGIVE